MFLRICIGKSRADGVASCCQPQESSPSTALCVASGFAVDLDRGSGKSSLPPLTSQVHRFIGAAGGGGDEGCCEVD